MTTDQHRRLAALGRELERAVGAQLRADARSGSQPAAPRRRRRRLAVGAAALVLGVPAAALGANALLSTQDVAQSLPAGTRALIGTQPTCTVVTANVEYHCTLAEAPSNPGAPVPASNAAKLPFKLAHLHGRDGEVLTRGSAACRSALVALGQAKASAQAVRAWRLGEVRSACAIRYAPAMGASGPSATTGSGAGTDWTGTVEPTVDATRHVNGGCRALTAEGTSWECYIGQAAVAQKIVSAGFLGQYSPAPGVG
jgi:hypothetical protein